MSGGKFTRCKSKGSEISLIKVMVSYGKEKHRFYELVDRVVSLKGEDWFNAWSDLNPITHFIEPISDEELSEQIFNLSEVSCISAVNYSAMIEKLEKDLEFCQ